jgi:hypothetical protein
MTEQAQQQLADLLMDQGVRLVNTPTMCEILLKQKFAHDPDTVTALLGVYRLGRVEVLLALSEGERDHLAQAAVRQHGLSVEAAQGAVAAWTFALEQAVAASDQKGPQLEPTPDPKSLEQPFRAPMPRSLVHSLLVVLAGALGGLFPGVYNAFHLEDRQNDQFYARYYRKWPYTNDAVLFGLVYGGVGLFAGTAGAALGWLVSGSRHPQYLVDGRIPLGILLGGIVGAMTIGGVGAWFGFLWAGPPGVLGGSFLGTGFGTLGDYLHRRRRPWPWWN